MTFHFKMILASCQTFNIWCQWPTNPNMYIER